MTQFRSALEEIRRDDPVGLRQPQPQQQGYPAGLYRGGPEAERDSEAVAARREADDKWLREIQAMDQSRDRMRPAAEQERRDAQPPPFERRAAPQQQQQQQEMENWPRRYPQADSRGFGGRG